MKKLLTTIFPLILLLAVVFMPQQAQAACGIWDFSIAGCAADLGTLIQSFFGLMLSFAGAILNLSIKLTLNIHDIYLATPVIDNVWVIIRNFSSIFIIFILLYVSIETILGIAKTNIRTLVINIVIAGVLINFSLFFTKVAIDASNLVSLQFYKAIAPEYNINTGIGTLKDAFSDGGISNIFMNSLKIQSVYDTNNSGIKWVTDNGKILASIVIGTYGGILLMLFAGISFLGAAVAFTIRTGMLLLLMAFSPVYFAGMIFPKVKSEVSDLWFKNLFSQLIFMPAYLILMYVALRVISDPGFMSFLQTKEGVTNGSTTIKQLGVVMQYFIAIIFINVPLMAAIKLGGMGAGFAADMTKGLRSKIYGQPAFLGQHTFGRAAKALQSTVASSGLAARNPNAAVLTNKLLGQVSGASFGGSKGGYDKRVKDYVKTRSDFAKKLKTPENVSSRYVVEGMAKWEKEETQRRANLGLQLSEVNKRQEDLTKMMRTGSPDQQEFALNKLKEVEAEKAKLQEQAGKSSNEARSNEKERLDKASKNIRQNEFAESLSPKNKENQPGILKRILTASAITSKADKEAAETIRKEMSKGKKDKLLDSIQEAFREDKPEKEDKGGGEGGGKK